MLGSRLVISQLMGAPWTLSSHILEVDFIVHEWVNGKWGCLFPLGVICIFFIARTSMLHLFLWNVCVGI